MSQSVQLSEWSVGVTRELFVPMALTVFWTMSFWPDVVSACFGWVPSDPLRVRCHLQRESLAQKDVLKLKPCHLGRKRSWMSWRGGWVFICSQPKRNSEHMKGYLIVDVFSIEILLFFYAFFVFPCLCFIFCFSVFFVAFSVFFCVVFIILSYFSVFCFLYYLFFF